VLSYRFPTGYKTSPASLHSLAQGMQSSELALVHLQQLHQLERSQPMSTVLVAGGTGSLSCEVVSRLLSTPPSGAYVESSDAA
jgi:hypothetical protein